MGVRIGRRSQGRRRRRQHVAMLNDVLDVLAVQRLIFEKGGGDFFHRVAVRGDDFPGTPQGGVD